MIIFASLQHLPFMPKKQFYFVNLTNTSTELRHESLKPEDGKFDYELHAELYNMGTYFNFLEFKAALVDMGVSCLNKDIRHYKARPRKLSQAKIDQLLSAVGVAYSGTFNNQATLREMYVHFFTECFDSVQQDKYFHSAIGLVKQFSLDLMRSVNRKAGKTVMTVPIKTTATNPPGATATKPPTMTGAITRAKPPAATAASSTDETDTSTESDSDSSTDSDSDFDADSESESIYETANEFEVAVKATVSRALASATRSLLAASASGLKATARR